MQKASEIFDMSDTFDFSLPVIESSLPANKVRLHISDVVCESCSS